MKLLPALTTPILFGTAIEAGCPSTHPYAYDYYGENDGCCPFDTGEGSCYAGIAGYEGISCPTPSNKNCENHPSTEAEPGEDDACTSKDKMRYWNGKIVGYAGYIRQESNVLTKEDCMDMCLSDSECLVFIHGSSKNSCQLYTAPTSPVTYQNSEYSTGVRCSRWFQPSDGTPPDGTYPTPDPCDEKGCSDGCTNVDGNAVCDCRSNTLLVLDGTECVEQCSYDEFGCDSSTQCHNPTETSPAYCSCRDTRLTLDATGKKCVEKCTIDNGGCDDSAVCTNPTKAGDDAVCSCKDPSIFDDTNTKCVQKCTVNNGGCDDSAVCTNPTKAGDDVVCSCATGEQFASDGETCTSTADAEKYCPTSTCWTYEMVKGTNKCVMKTGSAAKDAGCNMYLHCTPSIMDFRWNSEDLLGANTVHNNPDATCAIEDSAGDVGETTPENVDKMWKHAPASCDSTVTREDVNGEDMIVITKSFVYQGDTTGKNVGSMIYLDDAATVTIDVCCKFKATQSATSDDISIEAGNAVAGKLDAEGSWDGSLTIEFTDNAYTTKKTDAAKLGEMHYVKVSWTVGATALANKVNWYVDDCTVSDTTDANKKVDIIENQCFASVINAINESKNMLSTSDFKFEFKSFSFNAAGTGSQKLSCNINFCLKETECAAQTDKTGLDCDVNEAEKWVVPN